MVVRIVESKRNMETPNGIGRDDLRKLINTTQRANKGVIRQQKGPYRAMLCLGELKITTWTRKGTMGIRGKAKKSVRYQT